MAAFCDIAQPGIAQLGTYEPGRPLEEVARELGFEDASFITKVASNENALGPSPKAVAAIHEAASRMHRYPDGGAFYLKRALGEKLALKPSELLPGNGSNELIELLAHVFLAKGSSIVMATHAFVVYRLLARAAGAEVLDVPMQNFTHDLEGMLAAIREDTRIVFISNPNNPTSTVVSADAIDRFMQNVPDHTLVCFDEAYIELLEPEQQPPTLEYVREGRNVVVLRTFSKTYGLAGLRIGYAAAPESCITLLNRVRQPFNVNAMALAAAEAALGDDEHVEKTRVLVREGLAYLVAACEELGLDVVSPSANFVLVKTGKGRKVFELCQREGVIVRPMDGYGLPDYVRVTVGTMPENERVIRGLKNVLRRF